VGAHRGIELTLIQEGTARYRSGAVALEAGPGAVVVVPAGAEHATELGPGLAASVVELGPRIMEDVAEATDLGGRRLDTLCRPEGGARLGALVAAIREEALQPGNGQALAIEGLLDALVVGLLRLVPAAPAWPDHAANDARIARAIALVRSRLAEEISLDDMARAATMSRFHFSRRFREATGSTPYAFLIRSRVDRATELLQRGRHSISEAAIDAGFRDFGRFRRAFRAVHGITPSAFAAATRRHPPPHPSESAPASVTDQPSRRCPARSTEGTGA